MFADFGLVNDRGKRTDGRGASFKSCLMYHLHDKRGDDGVHIPTSDRAAVIDMGNFSHLLVKDRRSINVAKNIWRSMMHLADARDAEYKAGAIRGRPCEKPVFSYVCSFHSSESPSMDDLQMAMRTSLDCLGLSEHQYVCVAHNDGGAVHIHVIVNMIHPETLRVADNTDNRAKLKNWAMKWDLDRGLPFSDALIDEASMLSNLMRAEFIHMVQSGDINGMRHARAIAIRAKKAGEQNNSRKEWRKERGREEHKAIQSANDSASTEAREIKERFSDRYREIKAINDSELAHERAEIHSIYEEQKQKISEIYNRYNMGNIRPEPNWFSSLRGMISTQEKREWKSLYRRIYQGQAAFEKAERDASGRLWNAIKLTASIQGDLLGDQGRVGIFIRLMNDPYIRASMFSLQCNIAKKSLRESQDVRWHRLTKTPSKAMRDAAIAAVRHETTKKLDVIKGRHCISAAIRKGRWLGLKEQRGAAWVKYAQKYKMGPSVVVRMGHAPYAHNPSNIQSFYVELDNGRTYWGRGLESAIRNADVRLGDVIKITSRLEKTIPFNRVNGKKDNRSGFFRRRFIIDLVANDFVRKYDPRNTQNISKQFNSNAKRLNAISYSNFLNERKGFTQDKLSDVEDVPSLVAVFNNTGRAGAMNAQLIAQRQKIKQFRQEANIVTNLKRKKAMGPSSPMSKNIHFNPEG